MLPRLRDPVALAESRSNKIATRKESFVCSGPDCAAPVEGGADWSHVLGHRPPLLPARFLSLCDPKILRRCAFAGDAGFGDLENASLFLKQAPEEACQQQTVQHVAARRLRDFYLTGTLERLADTALAFALRFGLDLDGLAKTVREKNHARNPSVHYFHLSNATRAVVANETRVDAALYDIAVTKLDAVLERYRARATSPAAFDARRRSFFADAGLPPPPALAAGRR